MTDAEPLEVAAWRRELRVLAAEDLPELATDALVRGLDSPSLRILAGQNRHDIDESRELFELVLPELNIEVPDRDTATWGLVRLMARDIVRGVVPPEDGVRWISDWAAWDVEEEGDLRIFVGLNSDWDSYPSQKSTMRREMVVAATELLGRAEPRRWIKLRAVPGRSPVTRYGLSGHVDVDVAALPIDAALAKDVMGWALSLEYTLTGWPEGGGFRYQTQAESFVTAGRVLVERLQTELGPLYCVEFEPEPIRKPGVKLAQRRPWFRRR